MNGALAAGRRSFEQRAWRQAYAELAAADRQTALGREDLERLAMAAYLIGEDDVCARLYARAHQECLHRHDAPGAARCAFWLAITHVLRGEMAQAGGWLARATQVLDEEGDHECMERGFLLVPIALGHLIGGEFEQALAGFRAALEIGERCGDIDLITFGRLGTGQTLMLGGEHEAGSAMFDLLMVAVASGEVSPVVAGLAYCAVIETCQLTFDLRRAQEWTSALTRWCDAQPDLVPYRGQCLVHRAELLQLHGAWGDAISAAERAREELSRSPGHPAVGAAWYRVAELHRLRGALAKAEEAYCAASDHGHDPQPGLALLRVAQGQPGTASAAIRRAYGEAPDDLSRARLLPAYVEIVLGEGDVDAARAAARHVAEHTDTKVPVLRAITAQAVGVVELAAGEPADALPRLRSAWATWRDLEAPYEAARVRVAVGLACRQLGDEDGALLELRAAAAAFRQLGAAADLTAVEALAEPSAAPNVAGLSDREVQVLALLATGMTNRAIAADLVVSQKTVARHVANIFLKLGVTSRSAATAYAYEHGLAHRTYTP